jgi:Domain of unknown function (DUF4440)
MKRLWIAALLLACAWPCLGQSSPDEDAVWKLEHSYWDYVKAQDVERYKDLWAANFLGWPSFAAQPQRKNHITDWLIKYNANGLRLKSYEISPTGSQATGELVAAFYIVTTVWTKNSGSEQTETLRIMHTWLRGVRGWQIINGMSAAEPRTAK